MAGILFEGALLGTTVQSGGSYVAKGTPGSQMPMGFVIQNNTEQPIDLAYLVANPKPINQPTSGVLPPWAFASSWPAPLGPGQELLGEAIFAVPTVEGASYDVSVLAEAFDLIAPCPSPLGCDAIPLLAGSIHITVKAQTPMPGEPPVSSKLSPIIFIPLLLIIPVVARENGGQRSSRYY